MCFTGFWVVHFRGDSAEFLVELSLRWAPQGHLGFQGEIRGGSCHMLSLSFQFPMQPASENVVDWHNT